MGVRLTDIIITLIFNVIHCVHSDHILPCDPNEWRSCIGEHQICNAKTKICDCDSGYVFVGDDCLKPDNRSSNHTTAAVVITFTLALIICGLVLVIRKYNLVEYVRNKINNRQSNNVMYEDVMIGQDDPPLSP